MSSSMMTGATLIFLEISGLFFGLTVTILTKINQEQPEPYMDEIFHIPQAQAYCEGNFSSWDPMITTPPGLYLASIGLMKPLAYFFKSEDLEFCSPFWLRLCNVLFAVGNLYLLCCIVWKLHSKSRDFSTVKGLLLALNLAIFPTLYFFSFLYYTDASATYFILLMYLLSLYSNNFMAAVMGSFAVLMRQTSITWVLFTAGAATIHQVLSYMQCSTSMDKDNGKQLNEKEFFDELDSAIRNALSNPKKGFCGIVGQVLYTGWPYMVVLGGFIGLVVANEGLALGDKTSHVPVFHMPQFFYLLAFMTIFAFPYTMSYHTIAHFVHLLNKHMLVFVVFGCLMVPAIYFCTYAHPYTLSDNRHYTFYLWQRVFQRHELVKYFLIPSYVFSLWTCYMRLHHQTLPWKLLFVGACLLSSVPHHLLEMRYFVIPYLLFRLHSRSFSAVKLCVEFVTYFVVNFFTIRMFLEKPFEVEGISGVQRFMW